ILRDLCSMKFLLLGLGWTCFGGRYEARGPLRFQKLSKSKVRWAGKSARPKRKAASEDAAFRAWDLGAKELRIDDRGGPDLFLGVVAAVRPRREERAEVTG